MFNKFKSFLLAASFTALCFWSPSSSVAATDTLELFYNFELAIHQGEIDLEDDTFKIVLSNTAPTMTWSQLSSVTEIASGNGYTTGGAAMTVDSLSQTSGTVTWDITSDVTWTASGGAIATFRYAYIYDDTHASDLLVGVLDYGSAVDVESGQTFTIACGGVTMLTVTI